MPHPNGSNNQLSRIHRKICLISRYPVSSTCTFFFQNFQFSVLFFTVMFRFYFKCGSKSWDRILESSVKLNERTRNLCDKRERGLHFTSRTEIKCSSHSLFSCNCILHACVETIGWCSLQQIIIMNVTECTVV